MRPATFLDFAIAATAGNIAAYTAGHLFGPDPMRSEPARIAAFWLVGGLVFAVVSRRPGSSLSGTHSAARLMLGRCCF